MDSSHCLSIPSASCTQLFIDLFSWMYKGSRTEIRSKREKQEVRRWFCLEKKRTSMSFFGQCWLTHCSVFSFPVLYLWDRFCWLLSCNPFLHSLNWLFRFSERLVIWLNKPSVIGLAFFHFHGCFWFFSWTLKSGIINKQEEIDRNKISKVEKINKSITFAIEFFISSRFSWMRWQALWEKIRKQVAWWNTAGFKPKRRTNSLRTAA